MQTTMRAGTMLAVLIGLPAAWVYYGPLPPQAQRVVDRFVVAAKEAVEWDRLTMTGDSKVTPPGARVPVRTVTVSPPPAQQAEMAPQPASLAERVEPLLAQLRNWGAEEYQLEPWGEGGCYFRFSCAMPIVEGAAATQLFEAVAADPQASIERVVADVAAWQATKMTAMR